jgi:hypothetical protein
MAAIEITADGTPRGWFAGLFAARPMPATKRYVRVDRGGPVAPHLVAAQTVMAMAEERSRAATSGFEMGEYEPLLRRN